MDDPDRPECDRRRRQVSVSRNFHEFLRLPDRERRDVFGEAARRLGTLPEHVEKDFWVCFVLDLLFTGLPDSHPGLFFKGGTSLSKAFGAIERLSEDIDLVVDRRDLGFTGERDPLTANNLSNKRRRSLLDELRGTCATYVGVELLDTLSDLTSDPAVGCTVSLDTGDHDGQTLLIAYPALYPAGQAAYVPPTVKVEGGAKSATGPSGIHTVTAFIASVLGDTAPRTDGIRVISAKRTYWEKLLILHGWSCGFRDEGRLPKDKDRVSRHYYDAAMLTASEVGKHALKRLDILDAVRNHNLMAFRQAWKRFEEAAPGSLKLTPHGELQEAIERDYRAMTSMIFGNIPEFGWIVDQLRSAEQYVNAS